jgi:hypothetical protein
MQIKRLRAELTKNGGVMKKDSVISLISLTLLLVGILGYTFSSGTYLWIGLIGSTILLTQIRKKPSYIYLLFGLISIAYIIFFIFKLFISF